MTGFGHGLFAAMVSMRVCLAMNDTHPGSKKKSNNFCFTTKSKIKYGGAVGDFRVCGLTYA